MNGILTYIPFVYYKLGGCARSTCQQCLEYHLSRFALGDGVSQRNPHALCIFEFLKTPCRRISLICHMTRTRPHIGPG